MLMNGKEVNHLVINGEAFDKSYVGRQVKIVKTIEDTNSHLTANGGKASGSGGSVIDSGQICTVMANYHSFFYCYVTKRGLDSAGFWAKRDEFEFIDEKVVGGVNSPSYLLFIYYCVVLLALGVLLPC